MVQRIEELRPELGIEFFIKREFFRKVKVQVRKAWASHNPYAGVAEQLVGHEADRSRGGTQRHEGAGVEPAVDGALAVRQGAVGDSIRPAPPLAADVDGLRLIDGQWQPRLCREDRREFPAA